MKLFGKAKDGMTDDLLRAYVSRSAGTRRPHPHCPDFDPDLANAYVERGLAEALRSRYEAHLAECAACRKSVVVLGQLAAAEAAPLAPGAQTEPRPSLMLTVRQWLGAMSAPQWGMAAAAVVVLAISLPLLLSSAQRMRENKTAAVAVEPVPSGQAQDASPAADALATSRPDDGTSARSKTEASAPKSPSKRESDDGSLNGTLAANTQGTAEKRPASEQSNNETKSVAQVTDEAPKKSETQIVAQVPAEQGSASQTKTDSESARQQTGKDGAQSGELSKRADDQVSQKERDARAEAAPPPAPSVERSRSGQGLRRSLGLRERESSEAARLPEKKVGNKNFRLKDGTWTDKDFDPDKDLPVITLIRDSNVYKEVFNKHVKLRTYLTGFQQAERAIFVYKGTVYKIIPQ